MFRILLCALLAFLGCSQDQPRSSTPSDQPERPGNAVGSGSVPVFDGKRAFDYLLKQTSFGPRNPGSAGHQSCLDYLTATLQQYTPDVRVQEFLHTGYDNETLHLANVIASFNPGAATRILLCAHWDTRPRADQDPDRSARSRPILGANDGASGVAVLLELGSLMHSAPPSVGVDLLFLDGEDYGREGDLASYFLGSRHFAATKPSDYVPRFGILLDMVGDASLELPQERYSLRYAPDVVALVWNTARVLGYGQFVDTPGEEIMDDHLPLNEAGIKTIDIIDFNYPDGTNRYWHTHQDTPDHCSAESLGAVGTVVTHVVYSQQP